MTNDDRIAELGRQCGALVDLAESHGLHLDVPACPGWSTGEVVRHTGGGHRWCSSVLDGGEALSSRPVGEPSVEDDDLLPWFTQGVAELLERLRTTPPGRPTWTPVAAGTAEWWMRKMVVETAIHRWDVAAAIAASSEDEAEPVPPAVAADGIDEYLGDFVTGLVARAPGERPGGLVELRAAEGLRWVVDLGPGPAASGESGSEGAADRTVVEGSASDLLLWLWNRLAHPLVHLGVSGDERVVERWRLLVI
jgi:uncharacterized protein (TIGR03083 family)